MNPCKGAALLASLLASLLTFAPALGSADEATGFAACEQLFASRPEAEASSKCFFDLGSTRGQGVEAARRLEAHRRGHPGIPWPSLYLAHQTWKNGDLKGAERLYREAAGQFASRGMARSEIDALYSLIYLLSDRGLDAGSDVQRVVRVAEESADPSLIGMGQFLEAMKLTRRGEDQERAYQLFGSAREFVLADGRYRIRRDYRFGLGTICVELGKYREAREHFGEAADLAARTNHPGDEDSARYNLLRVQLEEMTEVPQAGSRERLTQEALDAAGKSNQPRAKAKVLWILAMLSRGREARGYVDQCLAVAPDPLTESSCLNAKARNLAREGSAEARTAADLAVELAERTAEGKVILAQARLERMHASWALDPPSQAFTVSRPALAAIEDLRNLQGSSAEELFSTWVDEFHWLAGRLFEAHLAGQGADLLEKAFAVTEQMRARTLLDQVGADREAPADKEHATLAQVQQTLHADEALLSFQIAPLQDWTGDFGGGSWLLVLTSKDTRVYRLPDRAELRQKIKTVNGRLKDSAGSQSDAGIAGNIALLHKALLAAALKDLPHGVEKLIVVPDDVLYQLPFSLLRAEPGAKTLAEHYELTLEPSATLWRHWKGKHQPIGQSLALVLAAPAPVPKGKELPYAEREGRKIRRRLDGCELLLGKRASVASLHGMDLSRFGILHFATHSEIDEAHPERSFVLLAPSPGHEDGRLQAQEIQEMPLDGRVVVLSSCRGAGGRVLRGEGVMSLARAFFLADASTVVASLWPQRDDDAALLFDRFYHHLAEGVSVTSALRSAQIDRIGEGAPAAAWAGFIVLGDGDLVPIPGGIRRPALGGPIVWAGVLLALLLLALFFRFSRFCRRPRASSSTGGPSVSS